MALTLIEDKIMRAIRHHRVSISEIEADIFPTNRPSRRAIGRALAALVKNGHLIKIGTLKGTKYEKAVH